MVAVVGCATRGENGEHLMLIINPRIHREERVLMKDYPQVG